MGNKIKERKPLPNPVISDILLMSSVELITGLVSAKKYLLDNKSKKEAAEVRGITDALKIEEQDELSLLKIPMNYIEAGFPEAIQEYHSKLG